MSINKKTQENPKMQHLESNQKTINSINSLNLHDEKDQWAVINIMRKSLLSKFNDWVLDKGGNFNTCLIKIIKLCLDLYTSEYRKEDILSLITEYLEEDKNKKRVA